MNSQMIWFYYIFGYFCRVYWKNGINFRFAQLSTLSVFRDSQGNAVAKASD